uniref:Uncharacterized protein n=1 Tax=Pararge aegeria TaxID=116150 RepID=S4NLB9_9NEOP
MDLYLQKYKQGNQRRQCRNKLENIETGKASSACVLREIAGDGDKLGLRTATRRDATRRGPTAHGRRTDELVLAVR